MKADGTTLEALMGETSNLNFFKFHQKIILFGDDCDCKHVLSGSVRKL
jgi:hypothetical protein